MAHNFRFIRTIDTLAARAQVGDEAASEQLIRTITPTIRRVIRRTTTVTDDDHLDDLVSQVHLRIYSRLATFHQDEQGHFLGWVTVVTRNLVIDAYRRVTTRQAYQHAWADDQTRMMRAAAPTTEVVRLREILASRSLTAVQREIVVAYYVYGDDCATIARQRGITQATVWTHLKHARARIKAAFLEAANDG